VSLIITVVTPYAAVQVSDMRITAFQDGTVMSGQQRKSIIMQGSQAMFVIGWTGLATIANHNTGEWLHGQLDAMSAPSLPLETIVKTLTESATLHFATLPKTDKRSTFSLGGWFVTPIATVEPFSARVTNCEAAPAGTLAAVASVKFEYGIGLRNPKKPQSKHPYMITVTGNERTALELKMYWRGLRGLLQHRADSNSISTACRQIALAVAAKQEEMKEKNPQYVKTVGKSLLAIEMDNSGATRCLFYPEDGASTLVLAADIVSPALSTKSVTMDRKVNKDGDVEIRLKGWFKRNV
jgi:hypothetical protein